MTGPPMTSPSLVGRERELTRLRTAFEQARRGRHTVLMVRGEAGVGKTRLLREFLATARDQGATALSGDCVEVSAGELPFVPIRTALRFLVRDRGVDEAAQLLAPVWSDLTVLLPELAHRTGGNGSTRHAFEVVSSAFDALVAEAPLVLAVDDMQWADLSTLQLLQYVGRTRQRRLLLVLCYRGEDLPLDAERRKAMEELGRAALDVVEVSPLTQHQVADLVRSLSSGATSDEISRVVSRSDGLPFLVEELVAAERDGVIHGMPPRFREVLTLRLGALSDAARQLVELVAVAGRALDRRVVASASPVAADRLTAAVDEAQAANLLVEDAERRTYAFRHDLVRELVYGELRSGTRTALHARLATALEQDLPPDPYASRLAEVAHHWLETDHHDDRAIQAALRAARASTVFYAHPEACRQYDQVLALWHRVADPERLVGCDLAAVLTEAAEAAHWAGRTASAIGHIDRALEEVDPQDEALVAVLHDRRTLYSWLEGTGLARGPELLEHVGQEASRERMRASELMQRGRYLESVDVARRAVQLARAARSPGDEIRANIILGLGLAMTGQAESGVARIREALDRAATEGTTEEVVAAYANLAFVFLADGEFEEAAAVALVGLEEAVRRGAAVADGALLAGNAAEALTRLGRLGEADRVLRDALGRQPPAALANVLRLAGVEVDVLRGDMSSADATLRRIADDRTLDDYQFQSQLRCVEAELQLWDPSGGHAVVLPDLRTGPASAITDLPAEEDAPLEARLVWLAARADADAAAHARLRGDDELVPGLEDDADRLVDRARSLSAGELSAGARRQVEAFEALAVAERARLSGAAGSEPWERAAAASLSDVYLHTYALWRQAAALRAERRRRDAGEVLRASFRLARQAELRVVADAARSAGASLGINVDEAVPRQPGPARESRPYHLTAKEMEVLQLLVAGHTNRRIARALDMSEKTASVHVSRILAKLAVSSRGEAVARAYEVGLARPDTLSTGGSSSSSDRRD